MYDNYSIGLLEVVRFLRMECPDSPTFPMSPRIPIYFPGLSLNLVNLGFKKTLRLYQDYGCISI
jgi:hypothetical protein